MSSIDPSKIEELSEKFLASAIITPPNAARPNLEELEIPEATLISAFEDRGMTSKQVTDFATTASELSKAAHHAATKHNIIRIKAAVSEQRDPRALRTRVGGSIGRAFHVAASSTAVKEGETTLRDGIKKEYQTFGSGNAQVVMGAGLNTAMSQKLAEEVRAICEESSFVKPLGK